MMFTMVYGVPRRPPGLQRSVPSISICVAFVACIQSTHHRRRRQLSKDDKSTPPCQMIRQCNVCVGRSSSQSYSSHLTWARNTPLGSRGIINGTSKTFISLPASLVYACRSPSGPREKTIGSGWEVSGLHCRSVRQGSWVFPALAKASILLHETKDESECRAR
ncbi:hypothetical protein LX36DRAFT_109462 [Colletotrichum falcatum]|nr:hypothetical protein LX36DRAFT_109462 [Colletotrichum falcatum]